MQWTSPDGANTINNLGYSPNSFEYYSESYLTALKDSSKPAWFSISGYAHEVAAPSQLPRPEHSHAHLFRE